MSDERMIRDDSLPAESRTEMSGIGSDASSVPENRPAPRWAERTLMESFEDRPVMVHGVSGDGLASAEAIQAAPPVSAAPEASTGLRLGSVLRETLETIVLALLIFITVRAVIQNFKVEGSSMEPNLHSGQYLLVNKAAYFSVDLSPFGQYVPWVITPTQPAVVLPFGHPDRGDVVVFRYPRDPRRDFIKRIIAVPGDAVTIREGRVIVNGVQLDEPYIIENTGYSREATTVPPGHFYVLGDNRNNSSDSHVWGPVPRENIIGKAWLSYWPLSDWGLAPNYPVAAGD